MSASARFLPDGRRLHLQHGPIDLIIEAVGPDAKAAYARAEARFPFVLPELVAELPALRQPLGGTALEGPVARRMAAACAPYGATFITPMAAVAGSVADEILAEMLNGTSLTRAYVNNGGDIALHLAAGESFTIGLVAEVARPAIFGRLAIIPDMGVGGIATSGWSGRSFSLGIADAVTVLARCAAAADAAATMIANRVDADHPAITRAPADSLQADTDLGARLVTTAVGDLPDALVVAALDLGEAEARKLLGAGLIEGAVLVLKGRHRVIGQSVVTESVVRQIP